MKHAPKLIAAIAIFILALGVGACGDDDDGTNSTASSETGASSGANGGSSQSGGSQSEGSEGGADDKQGGSGDDDQNAAGTDDDSGGATGTAGTGGEDRKRTTQEEEKEAREFKPKTHEDAGGGSEQFIVKGGDNSIQEFGAETTGSDFEEASAALHNFYDARAEGNWAATCLYMSADQIKSLQTLYERSGKDVSCAEAVEGLTGGVLDAPLKEEAAAIDIASMRTEGDRAFLIYRGLEKGIYAIPMAKENGRWRVAGYGGSRIN